MKMWALDTEAEGNGGDSGQEEQRGGGEARGELKASHSLSSPGL